MSFHEDHNAITLHDCFNTSFLLLAKYTAHLQKTASNARAKTTLDTAPPRIWFPISYEAYTNVAEDELKKKEVYKALSRSYLPSIESPVSLASESDIVRASALWFLHPVMKAMQVIVPGASCSAEVVEPGVRCDVLVTVNGQNIAVLEYKNRGYVSKNEFMQACVPEYGERNAAQIVDRLTKGFTTDKTEWKTHLTGSSIILSKQAAAYATRFGTKYVALFDWDSLFLWYFAAMQITAIRQASHGLWAYGSWVEKRDRFRMALLGFFLRAYRERKARGSQYGNPSRDPWRPSQQEMNQRRQDYEVQQRQKIGSKNVDAYSRRW
ncbi:hypothetical protein GE09DRAFT_746693 [Coniochaeta sp. 2T2.1]|nr:hypothetical protein GE09DRAFT_746693 [Coniochaeta sp. 2T2.1]